MKSNAIRTGITAIKNLTVAAVLTLGLVLPLQGTKAQGFTSGGGTGHTGTEIRFVPPFTDATGQYHPGYFATSVLDQVVMSQPVTMFDEPVVVQTNLPKELPDRTYTEPAGPFLMHTMPNTTPYGAVSSRPSK